MRQVMVMVHSEAGFQRDVMRGIGRYSETHGPWRFVAPEESTEDRLFPRTQLRDPEVDGVLVTAVRPKDQDVLRTLKIPFVCLTMVDELPMVSNDNRAIGRMGAAHLVEQGFEHLAFVGMSNARYVAERKAAFVQAVEEAGVDCLVVDDLPWGWDRSMQPLRELLESLPLPCGIMASNDIRGRQIAEAAASLGIHVPEQLAVLGVDNDEPICALTSPPLSSIALNGERVGFEAAAMLDALMESRPLESSRVLVPPLGVETRHSTDAMVIDDPEVAAALRYIREHPREKLTTYDVMAHVSLGRRALERRFHAVVGRTLFEEIRRVQLEHVKRMLRQTNWSIDAVARASAFKSAKRLREVFQKAAGESPTDYRRRHDISWI